MKVTANIKNYSASIIIESGHTKIDESVSEGTETLEIIDNLITTSNDLSRFNNISDVDFVKRIYDAFLNDIERKQFLELIS